jgi:TolB-like protein
LVELCHADLGGWALFKPGAAAASHRIAVMRFSSMSGDPGQAYFADGIAEELRGALSRIGMQVIGKASCDAVKDLDTQVAAAKLGVANILTGSFRRSPETIRVGAQLVNGKDGVEKWAQNYDRAPRRLGARQQARYRRVSVLPQRAEQASYEHPRRPGVSFGYWSTATVRPRLFGQVLKATSTPARRLP